MEPKRIWIQQEITHRSSSGRIGQQRISNDPGQDLEISNRSPEAAYTVQSFDVYEDFDVNVEVTIAVRSGGGSTIGRFGAKIAGSLICGPSDCSYFRRQSAQ